MIGRIVAWSPITRAGTIAGSDAQMYDVRAWFMAKELVAGKPTGAIVRFTPASSDAHALYHAKDQHPARVAIEVREASRTDRLVAAIAGQRVPVPRPRGWENPAKTARIERGQVR